MIVERPTYEPLLRLPEQFGCRVRRFDRRFTDGWAIDLDRFATFVTARTKLAIVTNLHNPSGARIDLATLRAMAALLARVGATLLVDEVYLECEFGERTDSCVHAGPNVVTTCSLTKAYGLDGLRAGWLLGPPDLIRRAARIHDLLGANGVAPGEQMQMAAFAHLPAIRARAHALLDPNLEKTRAFFAEERRLKVHMPTGGNVAFPRLPAGDRQRPARRSAARAVLHAGRAGPLLRAAPPHPRQLRDARRPARARLAQRLARARRPRRLTSNGDAAHRDGCPAPGAAGTAGSGRAGARDGRPSRSRPTARRSPLLLGIDPALPRSLVMPYAIRRLHDADVRGDDLRTRVAAALRASRDGSTRVPLPLARERLVPGDSRGLHRRRRSPSTCSPILDGSLDLPRAREPRRVHAGGRRADTAPAEVDRSGARG